VIASPPYYRDEQVTLLLGDALEQLDTLDAGSVQCIVTSPPYYSLRDYGWDGQYGLEATPAEYIEQMCQLFAEARRVLADDGTLWLNLGDTYYSAKGASTGLDRRQKARRGFARPVDRSGLGYPRKSLLMIPARVAIALQEDGWTLRSEIIWDRINPLPEVASDRPARRTERLYVLAKQARYRYDRSADGAATDLWQIEPDRSAASAGHTAPFPLELAARCIACGSRPGDTILDPFSGSATTGEAALKLGRRYIGIDGNAAYHDQALTQRFAQRGFDFTAA
jgi:DNA modification methylase